MSVPWRPRLRPVEMIPVGPKEEPLLDDGRIRHDRRHVEDYLANPIRPASHAGGAYPEDPEELRRQLDALFNAEGGPGAIDPLAVPNGRPVQAILSPHIDPYRGGATTAWAYRALVEQSDADLLVIFGTAHQPMNQRFCISRKDFATPLGVARTAQAFIDRLAADLGSSIAGRVIDPFEDELSHRSEHSIEFQVLFLQHVLGDKRPFHIVPILVGSFQEFVEGHLLPGHLPEVQAFLAAVRTATASHRGKVCYISGADFAHIGRRFGDPWLLDHQRLAAQAADDQRLLKLVCQGDAARFFRYVARREDRSRICGLAPTYMMLAALGPTRGELLKYDQAVEADGTSCVSYASAAFYAP